MAGTGSPKTRLDAPRTAERSRQEHVFNGYVNGDGPAASGRPGLGT
jgi:hypothetical protein